MKENTTATVTTTATPEFMHPVVLEIKQKQINSRQKHNFIKNNKL
jgi:hypothetical protein